MSILSGKMVPLKFTLMSTATSMGTRLKSKIYASKDQHVNRIRNYFYVTKTLKQTQSIFTRLVTMFIITFVTKVAGNGLICQEDRCLGGFTLILNLPNASFIMQYLVER
jgi:hypothetical protein